MKILLSQKKLANANTQYFSYDGFAGRAVTSDGALLDNETSQIESEAGAELLAASDG